MKYAIATLYSGHDKGYYKGLLALRQSIITHNPEIPTIVLVEKGSLSDYDIFRLQTVGYITKIVEPIRSQPCQYKASRWVCTFTKLHVFNLTDYDKVLFLDADCILLKGIGHLFERDIPDILACWVSRSNPNRFNSGVMLLKPNASTFNEMREQITTLPAEVIGAEGGDQSFLNIYFQKYTQIADMYNQRHWNTPKPGIYIAHLRPHPWRGRKALKHQTPYIKIWNRYLKTIYPINRATEIINRVRDKHLVGIELGVLNGITSERILRFCPNVELHLVDIWSSRHYSRRSKDKLRRFSKDKWSEMEEQCRARVSGYNNCIIHKGYSKDITHSFEDSSLDFVFIDAEHTYKAVRTDILAWLPKLKETGSWIGGHDYTWTEVKRAVDQSFPTRKIRTGSDATWFVHF